MNEPVLFETVSTGIDMFPFRVKESFSGVKVGDFDERTDADKVRDYANAEHANGRIAQSRCQLGHACDRDRIHVPRMLRPSADVVLCDVHEDEIDSVRGCGL